MKSDVDEVDKVVIERLPLQHPLPAEIQKMGRDETVCQFCGVSYLIHREVKALEQQLAKVQADLARFEDSEEREQKLREDLEKMTRDKNAALASSQERDSIIKNLMGEIKEKNSELEEAGETKKSLLSQLEQSGRTEDKLGKQLQFQIRRLPGLHSSVQHQKSELQNLELFIHQMGKIISDSSQRLLLTVQSVCTQQTQEMFHLKEEISRLEQERTSLETRHMEMERKFKKAEEKVVQLEQVEARLGQKEEQCLQLKFQLERLENELDAATSEKKTLGAGAAQFEGLLKSKSQEVDDLQAQLCRNQQIADQLVSKLQQELKTRSAELEATLTNYRKLQHDVKSKEQTEQEIQRQVALSMGETDQIREALVKMREECDALKAERELLISSHQNPIEQLRESFKQKINDAEKWPSKVEHALQKERARHSQDLQELEEKLREAFTIELDIEKQRHQELTDRYKAEHQENDEKLKLEMRSLTSQHQTKLSQVERQLSSAKTQATTTEESLRKEIKSLINVIGDLERRLEKSGFETDGLVANLKAELREAEQDLHASREECRVTEDRLNQSREEILFLQETVRKECEERYELMESLSEAREQLLAYQRHGALTPRPTSAAKLHKQDSGLSGVSRKLSTGSLPIAQNQQVHSGGQLTGASTSKVGFDAGQARPPVSRSRDGSLSDSRKRIAAAVGRR